MDEQRRDILHYDIQALAEQVYENNKLLKKRDRIGVWVMVGFLAANLFIFLLNVFFDILPVLHI